MTRPYVVFAEGNIKTGCRVVLGPKTLVIGPNGTGKSTVANTLELALTGRVTDLVGRREVAKEAELMALAPSKKAVLQARVRLSDGSEAGWKVGGKTKKGAHSYPERIINPETVLPLRPVYEAVLGNVETARKFFMQYAVGPVGDADVLARIPGALQAAYKRATLTTAGQTTTAVDRLLGALEEAKKQARTAAAAAKASEGLSDQTASGLAPLPTEAEEKALRDALRAAEEKRASLRDRLTRREALAAALNEQEALKGALQAAELRYLSAKHDAERAAQALAAMTAPAASDPNIQAFKTVLALHAAKGLPACECCGQGLRNTDNPSFHWMERLRGLDAFLASQAAAAEAYAAAKVAANTTAVRAEQAFTEGKALYDRAQALAAIVGDGATDAPAEGDVAATEAQVVSLTEKLREVDALKASWAVASRARDGVVEAKRLAQEWKDLVEACTSAVAALLDGGVATFIAKVQAALPATDKYDLALRDGDRAVFQFGLHKEGVLRTALSGAEWSRVMAAMAAICAPPPAQVSVVIPEERAFDAATLSRVLVGFSGLDSQVVITSPIAPTTVPADWLVVDTTRGDHTTGVDPLEGARLATSGAGVVPLERVP